MKKMSFLVVCAAFLVILGAGCASPIPVGAIYANVKMPHSTTNLKTKTRLKMGSAESEAYFGIVAVGDSSIETAMKNGKIKKVHHVDWRVKNICGVARYKVIVYGE
jgi:TRL-like protein family